MTVLEQILEHKIVSIIRGADPADVLQIVKALYDGGVKLVEVTHNSPDAMTVLAGLSAKMGNKLLIGMGTVLDAATAKAAVSAGAKFIISPSFNIETIRMTKQLGAVSIPGAFTATEIVNAFDAGGDIIKLFPASGNVNYLKEIRAPLSHIPLMPTGGIMLENIKEFQQAGAVAFGIGTALVNTKEKVTGEYLTRITERAANFVRAIS